MTLSTSASPSLAEQYRTWLAAQEYGGSFVVSLATAWFRADHANRVRITNAFPEIADKYGPGSPFYLSQVDQ